MGRRREAGATGPAFSLERTYDLSPHLTEGDKIISALPDWAGRIWFATTKGVVGTVEPTTGAVKVNDLGEGIGNSFALDQSGGVFIVTDRALYRFDPAPDGAPAITWREVYPNGGIVKPGQTEDGSGTTPNLMGTAYVAITDNADPMDVVVYRRAKRVSASRLVCTVPVFAASESSTDNSLIGTGSSIIVENNYGYTGPTATMNGASTSPGIERVDINRGRAAHPYGPATSAPLGCPAVAERARIRVYQAAALRRDRRLVSDGDLLPHGKDRLRTPRRYRSRLQQQLRPRQHRTRRDGLRRGARWARAVAGRIATSTQPTQRCARARSGRRGAR
jgi:hypothetical protein